MRASLAGAVIEPTPLDGPWTVRPVRDGDADALAALMLEAYRGTIDDEGETLEGARTEVRRTFAGDYGDFLPRFSLVAHDDDRLVGAALITLWESVPFVAFTMTQPDTKDRGLATALTGRSLASLREAGYSEVRLTVTEGNEPALRVYEKLGFRAE
jgi:ribosomal protein S18 acetylase RimI-like enzyme